MSICRLHFTRSRNPVTRWFYRGILKGKPAFSSNIGLLMRVHLLQLRSSVCRGRPTRRRNKIHCNETFTRSVTYKLLVKAVSPSQSSVIPPSKWGNIVKLLWQTMSNITNMRHFCDNFKIFFSKLEFSRPYPFWGEDTHYGWVCPLLTCWRW